METDEQYQWVADRLTMRYRLTRTEGKVLFYILKGYNAIKIGEIFNISFKTVKKHVSAILAKTETFNRSEVQAIGFKELVDKWEWYEFQDKGKSRKSSHLQHQTRKYSTKKDTTKDPDTKQVEQKFDSGKERGENGE